MSDASRSSTAVAMTLGWRFGLARLRHRAFFAVSGLALSVALVGALIERRVTSSGSLDRTLEVEFRLVVPLFVFAVVGIALGRRQPATLVTRVTRFGAPSRETTLGLVAAIVAVSALACGVVVALSVLVAHGHGGASLPSELFTATWIAVLTGAAYAAWYSFGATFFRRGGGRVVPLVLDFVVGGAGFAGAILPRGNALNLLGFDAPMGLAQRASSVMLVATAVALGVGAALRSRSPTSHRG